MGKINGNVIAVNISEKKGTLKKNVGIGTLVEGHGLEGDAHAGKWHRQVSLLGKDTFEKMNNIVEYGGFGENITVEGICVYELPVGTKLKINSALLEVTQIGKKCHRPCEVMERVGVCLMPKEGIFAKVLNGGEIKVGDTIEIVGD